MQLPSVDVEKAKTLLMKGVLGDDWQAKIEGDRELSELVGSEGLRVAKEIPRLHITDAKFEGELNKPPLVLNTTPDFIWRFS
jgi:hypothetical protein